jgi:hypothetical protein
LLGCHLDRPSVASIWCADMPRVKRPFHLALLIVLAAAWGTLFGLRVAVFGWGNGWRAVRGYLIPWFAVLVLVGIAYIFRPRPSQLADARKGNMMEEMLARGVISPEEYRALKDPHGPGPDNSQDADEDGSSHHASGGPP